MSLLDGKREEMLISIMSKENTARLAMENFNIEKDIEV
jgi:hypothetical protein